MVVLYRDLPRTGPSGYCIWNLARQPVEVETDFLDAARRAHCSWNLARQQVSAEIHLLKARHGAHSIWNLARQPVYLAGKKNASTY